MLELAIMIEGQNGLTWERWERIARAVEELGFVGLYRSDHFTNGQPPDIDSLDAWLSLTWLASHTTRIEFGPLVSPVSFRHPVLLARMGSQVDDLSNGRLTLGVGAGWQDREHDLFGFDLLDLDARFTRFEESLEVITRLFRGDGPQSFDGQHYRLNGATLLPRPHRPGGPRLLIGGNGPRRTLPLAARFADEWNAVFASLDQLRELNATLDRLLDEHGRPATSVRRSLMTNIVFGRDQSEVERKLGGRDRAPLLQRGIVIGTPNDVVDQLGKIAATGAQRVMLQWMDLDDLDGLEQLAHTVLPQFK